MKYNRFLIFQIIIFTSTVSQAFNHTKLTIPHVSQIHHALKVNKPPVKASALTKYGLAPLHTTNFKDKMKTYFKDFGFHSYRTQHNQRMSSKGIGISYPLFSSFFTMVNVGVSKHIKNKKDFAIEPTLGLGFYFKTPKARALKTKHHLFAHRNSH